MTQVTCAERRRSTTTAAASTIRITAPTCRNARPAPSPFTFDLSAFLANFTENLSSTYRVQMAVQPATRRPATLRGTVQSQLKALKAATSLSLAETLHLPRKWNRPCAVRSAAHGQICPLPHNPNPRQKHTSRGQGSEMHSSGGHC